MDSPLVSICCLTYNHEKYIKEAIDSFLMQETDFNYEIIVHDDASTDGTADIIRDYAKKHSNIIPILQSENQYSKAVRIFSAYVFPAVRGKYIALCEGDDYWTDPGKLQKQAEYMENHPECSLCLHASCDITETGKFIKKRCRYKQDCKIPAEDIIFGGGGFSALSSTFYPARFVFDRPSYFTKAPVGDVPLHIFLASLGEIYYFHDDMSNYRTGVPGSWTSRVGDGNLEIQLKQQKAMTDMYKSFDEATKYKYHKIVEFMVHKCEIHAFRIKKQLKKPETNVFISIIKELLYIKSKILVQIFRLSHKIFA